MMLNYYYEEFAAGKERMIYETLSTHKGWTNGT